jgi:hypothetical protein
MFKKSAFQSYDATMPVMALASRRGVHPMIAFIANDGVTVPTAAFSAEAESRGALGIWRSTSDRSLSILSEQRP